MSTIALPDLRTEIKREIWPDGEPENLVASIDKFFIEGLIYLQRWVDCLRDKHTDVFPQCATYYKCGLTVLDAPRGRISSVYTVQSANYCDPVHYTQDTLENLLCWSRRFAELATPPINDGSGALPGGFRFADPSSDSKFGRAIIGKWALKDNRLYLAPWLQSRESAVIEWKGLKRKYTETDRVPDEEDLRRALRLFVQKEFARDFESDFNKAKVMNDEFALALADLMHECREETRLRPTKVCEQELDSLSRHKTEDDNPANVDVPTVVGIVSDYGTHLDPSWDVATLVKSWNPDAVVTCGDNNQPCSGRTGSDGDYDRFVGWVYRRYIYPYVGSQPLWPGEIEATVNRFWPCLGNHDLDNLAAYQSFFTLPGNERSYDVVVGAVHFFFVNDGLKTDGTLIEPLGNRYVDQQGAWLRIRLAQSTARWKVVIVHQPPKGSYRHYEELNWPFKAWGASVVISGHNHSYEHIVSGGFDYVLTGSGGGDLYMFGDTVAEGSQLRFDGVYGATKLVADCKTLTLQFTTRAGVVIDTVTLT